MIIPRHLKIVLVMFFLEHFFARIRGSLVQIKKNRRGVSPTKIIYDPIDVMTLYA
jgi:hypothetical protein